MAGVIDANSGSQRPMGSSSAIAPSSTSAIIVAAVSHFEVEATDIGVEAPIEPTWSECTTSPARVTRRNAPLSPADATRERSIPSVASNAPGASSTGAAVVLVVLLTTEAFVEGEVAAGVSVETAAELDPQAVASRSRPTAANRGSGITNPDRRGAPFR